MKIYLFIYLLLFSALARAADETELPLRISEATEIQLAEKFESIRKARSKVYAAISEVTDPKLQERYNLEFENNEKSWSAFINSSANLISPPKDNTSTPDPRIKRILIYDYAEFRILQFEEIAKQISKRSKEG